MKKRILFISSATICICLILIFIKAEFLGGKVPYVPIDYTSVDKVSIMGFTNKTSAKLNIKKLVDSINEIKKYERRDIPVYHSTPGPHWSITITLKNKQSITIYEDYDGQTKISNWQKSYIIDKIIAEQVLKENNLQKQMP